MRTTRFTHVVEQGGKPQVHVALVAPKQDRTLQRALREHRVLSVHQENKGHATDYGVVGLPEHHQGEVLIFPKSLRRFAGRRIVGIKYDLVEQPPLAPARRATRFNRFRPTAQRRGKATTTNESASPPPRSKKKRQPGGARNRSRSASKPKPAKATKSAGRTAASDLTQVLREVERATRELKSGKDVAAYERLQALLKNAGATGD